jgi:hypothetical protein
VIVKKYFKLFIGLIAKIALSKSCGAGTAREGPILRFKALPRA